MAQQNEGGDKTGRAPPFLLFPANLPVRKKLNCPSQQRLDTSPNSVQRFLRCGWRNRMGDVVMADKSKDGDIRKKLKMDEDPLSEGEWMSLADLRYKIARCVRVF
jgi:hypothetical protein